MNRNTHSNGFTLVELLIVIVVIAILAAISIVAYNGIQDRAKTTAGKELASQVSKKVGALNAITGGYFSGYGAVDGDDLNSVATGSPNPAPEAVLDDPSAVIPATSDVGSGMSA